jgi:DNA processing protein
LESKIYQIALQITAGIGNANAKYLISYLGDATEVYKSDKKKLKQVPGIGEKVINAIQQKESLGIAETIVKDCEKKGIQILHYTDDSYPRLLKGILDAPNIIYFQGTGDLNPARSVSIVGTRKATDYGKSIVKQLIHPLHLLKPAIFSGLAYGIDIEAHKEALTTGIPTFGVLAGGLDKIYPGLHKPIAEKMMENKGGLISEYPPGTTPEAHNFPARNRIIAGISEATIVVEAARKGGALITADIAHSYDRPVFAVPGDIGNPYSEGCNQLIRDQKALILTSENDLYYQLNWDLTSDLNEQKQKAYDNLPPEEQAVLSILQEYKGTLPIDELAWRSQVNITKLASILLNLEFKGIVKSLPGKKFSIV